MRQLRDEMTLAQHFDMSLYSVGYPIVYPCTCNFISYLSELHPRHCCPERLALSATCLRDSGMLHTTRVLCCGVWMVLDPFCPSDMMVGRDKISPFHRLVDLYS